ncbi:MULTISPECIES: kdo(2)-lipid IV(A) palmitoleoyltransferase [Xenorhabdus]|uniref:kdo(2)-lipid IV(A) palmitoleoyltransferase n=1 Tax=Xenorhabdus TaxID=626 RepID=UPI001E58B4FD|nr:kdo(2)-lipid IV(A) palmitoleoyltransferase [Xenorhabdus sp. PB30.3]MCC8378439.1 kdo(2)-lipid IV(A) palmitoleoyltransferase [Xenorhabdus sp. PB30.3]
MKKEVRFRPLFLHPRYWFTWFGLTILWLLVQLPYPVLMRLGASAGKLSRHFLKRRERITCRNIELCFPHISEEEKENMIAANFASLGMALAETGIAWFWSDRAVKRLFNVSGLENLHSAQSEKNGVMLIGIHFMSLELGGRISGLCQPMMAMYRPHNNLVMEYVQTKGRMRSNKAMIDRRDLKKMVRFLKQGESVWFAPDLDYGPKGSTFAPFFAVEKAATTNGTFVLFRLAKPAMVPIILIRNKNNDGYKLIIEPALNNYPHTDESSAAAYMNKVIERQIMHAPEQYLWLHRRFKTRPAGEESLYD